jgi:hypothetical protein
VQVCGAGSAKDIKYCGSNWRNVLKLSSFMLFFITIQRVTSLFAGGKAVMRSEHTSPISDVKKFN